MDIINANWIQEYEGWMQHLLHVVVILALALLILRFSKRLIRLLREYMSVRSASTEQVKRIETLGRVIRYAASLIISVVAVMLVLAEIGISIAPILATAGVVGIAVGFGAQSLIKDYFNGFFLLLENQIRQNDVVEVAGKAGLVEEVTLRYVRLRDYDGNVHFIPNGVITTVTNMSRTFSQSVIRVGISYQDDIDKALTIMRNVGNAMREAAEYKDIILEEMEIGGVDAWADSSVMLLCRFKVKTLEQWGVRREFLRRLKYAFDQQGIDIPFPHLTVYQGAGKDAAHQARTVLKSNK